MPTYYAVGKPVTVRHIYGAFYPFIIKNCNLTAQQVLQEGFSQTFSVRVFTTPENAKKYAQTKQVRTPGFDGYVLEDPPILVIEANASLELREMTDGHKYFQRKITQECDKIIRCSVEFPSRSSTILAVDIPKRTMGCVVA